MNVSVETWAAGQSRAGELRPNRTSGRNRRGAAILGVPWPRRTVVADPLAPFSPAVRDWFEASFEAPTDAQARGWAAIAERPPHADPRPDGQRQDPRRVPVVPRPPRDATRARPRPARAPGTVRVLYVSPAQGPHLRRRAQPAGAARPGSPSPPQRLGDASRRTSRSPAAPATRPAEDRRELARHPPDILVTTPEIALPAADERRPARSSAASSTSSSTRSTRSPARSAAPTSR